MLYWYKSTNTDVELAVSEAELRDFCFAGVGGDASAAEPLADLLGEGSGDPRFLVTLDVPELVFECSDRQGH